MGKKLNAILILMVLFTFASLLSEPPATDNVQTDSDHVSLSQASDAANTASVSTEANKTYAAPPEPDKSDAVVEQKKEAEPKEETRSINDPDVVDESDESKATTENTAEIETTTPDPSPVGAYQDTEWRKGVSRWMPVLSEDMQTLGTYTTNMDFEGMDSRSRLFKSNCNFALKESQKHTVSPELETSKVEYESSLTDFINAADQIQSAVDKINNNEIDAAIEYINAANVYINSGAEHMTSAAEAAQ